MSRVTISMSKELHRALKEAAARRGKTVGQLVEESLDACGIKPESEIDALLERVRAHSELTEEQAVSLGVEQTRAERRRR